MVQRRQQPEKIRCDACPVLCFIAEGRAGACDRYANEAGELTRVDPLIILQHGIENGTNPVPFLRASEARNEANDDNNSAGNLGKLDRPFVTAIGAGTTYPDYKPAPFIVSQVVDGIDMVTVVTEGIFSYCGVKVKIDTDRHLGDECAVVRVDGEPIGHVMTSEYGSKMLSLGGVDHLTGGTKKEGRITCDALLRLCNVEAVEMTIDGGIREDVHLIVEAGKPPIVNGVGENLMRVGCGSATIGMFADQWLGHVDEVIVVDDHITGVLSEHQAGKLLDIAPSGIGIKGRRSTPGRYFQVAEPGVGWGGTDVVNPLSILKAVDPKKGWEGARLLMVSTTGEHAAYFVLDADLIPQETPIPEALKASADLIAQNCEPSLCSVVFMGGAGGSLRSGVTKNPVRLTNSVKDALTQVTCGGAQTYRWPGGGITIMADVLDMPKNAFGYVPTPALVAPIEFTMRLSDYANLGGHMDNVQPIETLAGDDFREIKKGDMGHNPNAAENFRWHNDRFEKGPEE